MSIAEGKYELDLMRGYEESFRNRLSRVVTLSYDCMPLNPEQYAQKVIEVLDSMKAINPNDKDLNLFDEIILGKIEGQPAGTNFKQVVESIVGEISEEKLKAYLKQKSQQRSFGASNKDKNYCIRQVKKLQSLQKYFDVQEINKKRKFNKLFSTAIKSLAKYLELYSKIVESDPTTIEKAFEQYNTYNKEQKKFDQYEKEQKQSSNVIEKPPLVEEIKSQAEPEAVEKIEEERKITEIQQIKEKKQQEKKPQEPQTKTPKKSKSKKKESKPEDQDAQQVNSADLIEKEKFESMEKEKKINLEKQKQAKQKQKTVKKPNNKLLTEFFGFKKEKNVEVMKKPVFEEPQKVASLEQPEKLDSAAEAKEQPAKPQSIWDTFGQNLLQDFETKLPQLSSLRQQFRAYRMQNEQYNPEPHYTNIIMTLSTIEYYDYMMQVDREVDFRDPFKKIRNVLYFEDESEEFEGESADLDAEDEDQEQEDELSQGNHTILSDDHLSNEELSSCQVNDLHLKIEYGKGRKWVVNFVSRTTSILSEDQIQIYKNFSMICLETDQQTPLRLDEEQETVQFLMTPEIWRDVYKLSHGYYGTKDSIIKDLSALLPGMSKNRIDSILRERTEKIGNQRFIKKEFLDDLKEKVPEIDSLLEKVLDDRNEQLRKIKAEKNQEKDVKLQKDILECTGSRYIVNLIKQLKEKGYKQMRRNQLIEFINERKGEEWDKIKTEMNTMSRPIDELIRNMPPGEKKGIDIEQVVDDEEYKKPKNEGKDEANSNSSTKDKNDMVNAGSQNKKGSKIKDKKGQQKKQPKNAKIKRRRNKDKHAINIYQKTKPINRGRKTKNSLKTGIPTIEELKKQKQEEKNAQQEKDINDNLKQEGSDQEMQNSQSVHDKESINAQNQVKNQPEVFINEEQEEKNNEQIIVNGEEWKKSTDKSVLLSEVGEERAWSSRESPVKEEGTAQKSQRRDNVLTVVNIEQQ